MGYKGYLDATNLLFLFAKYCSYVKLSHIGAGLNTASLSSHITQEQRT